jgi:hypothetical protein
MEIDQKELLNFITEKVKDNISGIDISDKIFVSGKDVRNNRMFMDSVVSKPKTSIDPKLIDDFIGDTDESIRHYRVFSLPMWGGQMHLSVFLRFTVIGNRMFAEARYFLMPPLKDNLMLLDNIFSKSGLSYYYKLFIISLFKSTYIWLRGPILLLNWYGEIQKLVVDGIFGDPENKLKRQNETYNYGHPNSLREAWSAVGYQRYFQMVDKDLSYKVTQHIIINSIVEYLESKGISTEDIKEAQTTILNSGVMVTGGNIKAEQMAVGTGAILKSKVKNTLPKR